MSDATHVMVKETDVLSAKKILELLSSSIDGMKNQMKTNEKLTERNKIAIGGAVEALTDLHNLILNQLKNSRDAEAFDNSGDDHGGRFDA